ncbi:hypothetical protein AB0B12_11220 [Streptomyces sp. NPDC044780]|uniref:hypothetical protein n=1 Tax=unclassified Streptomyces TaxID=2593676 RepID=UPI0033E2BED8
MADWLDAQNPFVLEKLRVLDVGMRPPGGWRHYLAAECRTSDREPAHGRTPEHTHTTKRERE